VDLGIAETGASALGVIALGAITVVGVDGAIVFGIVAETELTGEV
jgi:hypothetical protein